MLEHLRRLLVISVWSFSPQPNELGFSVTHGILGKASSEIRFNKIREEGQEITLYRSNGEYHERWD